VELEKYGNRDRLNKYGGIGKILNGLSVSAETGLSEGQILDMRNNFGDNLMPDSPIEGIFEIFLGYIHSHSHFPLISKGYFVSILGHLMIPF